MHSDDSSALIFSIFSVVETDNFNEVVGSLVGCCLIFLLHTGCDVLPLVGGNAVSIVAGVFCALMWKPCHCQWVGLEGEE